MASIFDGPGPKKKRKPSKTGADGLERDIKSSKFDTEAGSNAADYFDFGTKKATVTPARKKAGTAAPVKYKYTGQGAVPGAKKLKKAPVKSVTVRRKK